MQRLRYALLIIGFVLSGLLQADLNMHSLSGKMPPRGLWSFSFTNLLRTSEPYLWGNWNIDASLVPGAVGYIDTYSGEFIRLGKLPNVTTRSYSLTSTIKLSTEYVTASNFAVDMQTGLPIHITPGMTDTPSIGVTVQWDFKRSGSMAAHWVTDSHERIEKPVAVMNENMALLQAEAASVNMYDARWGVSQGFGMITSVIWAKSGMNAAALSNSASLSFTGSLNNIESMFGLGEAQMKNKASFSAMKTEGAVNTVTWPAASSTNTDALIPIAYTFASLSGTTIIPNWIGTVNSFEIILNNTKSSYIVEATLNYNTPDGSTIREKKAVSGGMSASISNIPLEATNLVLKIRFIGTVHSNAYTLHWDKPLGHWLTGQRNIELHGIWPGLTSYRILEEHFAQ